MGTQTTGKGGGGGGGSNAATWQQNAYNNAYTASKGGQPWDTIKGNTPADYVDIARAGYESGQPTSFHMPHMPNSAHSGSSVQMPDYKAILAEQQAAAERLAGETEVKNWYNRKHESANAAADSINSLIASEAGHAAQYGLDYNITDEEKRERINNYFASLWSESDEKSLNDLIGKWGDQGITWDNGVERGEYNPDSLDLKDRPAGGKVAAKSQSNTSRTVLTEDEVLGTSGTALGKVG